jgi:conjugative transfer region lipoprotein (TIGR03751 family)
MKTLTISFFSAILVAALGGCTLGVVDPVKGSPTMKQSYYASMQNQDEIYNDEGYPEADDNGSKSHKRIPPAKIALPSLSGALQSSQLLRQQAQDGHDFPLLPNPQIVMYIYPHFEGAAQMPVHGNWTSFPLFTQNHYALPSEVQTNGSLY